MDMPARPLERYVREWITGLAENPATPVQTTASPAATASSPIEDQEAVILRLTDYWDHLPAAERNEALGGLVDRIYVYRGPSARSPSKHKRVLVVPTWEDDPVLRQWLIGRPPTAQQSRTQLEPGAARTGILGILSRHPATVTELATALSTSTPSITKHLRRLVGDDLVVVYGQRRTGKTTARLFVASERCRRSSPNAYSDFEATDEVNLGVTGLRQVDVLRLLSIQRQTARQISERLGFSEINGRKHLQLLAQRGLIAIAGSTTSGRGRPAKMYELTQRGRDALAAMRNER
jgi:predicted ArsR family transcriptional regulator